MRRWRRVKWVSSSSPRLAAVYEGSFSSSLLGEDSNRMHRHLRKVHSVHIDERRSFCTFKYFMTKIKEHSHCSIGENDILQKQSKLTSFSLSKRMNIFIQINLETKRPEFVYFPFWFQFFIFDTQNSYVYRKINTIYMISCVCCGRKGQMQANFMTKEQSLTTQTASSFFPSRCLVRHRFSVNKIAFVYVWYRIGHSRITSSLTTIV